MLSTCHRPERTGPQLVGLDGSLTLGHCARVTPGSAKVQPLEGGASGTEQRHPVQGSGHIDRRSSRRYSCNSLSHVLTCARCLACGVG